MDSETSKPPKWTESTDSDSKTVQYNLILKLTFSEKTFLILFSLIISHEFTLTQGKSASINYG
jgi:hypothetical protein